MADITIVKSEYSNITKTLYKAQDEHGNTKIKPKGGGQLWDGTVRVRTITLDDYVKAILEPKDEPWIAIYGTPNIPGNTWELITKKDAQNGIQANQITRTRNHFEFKAGQPGFFVEDYDPPKFMPDKRDTKILTKEELYQIIVTIVPELKKFLVKVAIIDSTSSWIYDKATNELLKGEAGKRIIIEVSDASKIPEIRAEINARLWLNGYGRHKITKAGSLIKGTIFDDVYGNQPERVDFTPAGAKCAPDIYQKRTDPLIRGANILDPTNLKHTRQSQKIEALIAADREARSIEAKPIKATWKAAKVKQMLARDPTLTKEQASQQVEALYRSRLGPDILLTIEGFDEPVSVKEVLDNPELYHNKRCYPPLDESDEEYQRYCAIIYSDQDEPVIHTFAHGNIVYKFPSKSTFDGRQEYVYPFKSGNADGAKALMKELVNTEEFFSSPSDNKVFVVRQDKLVGLNAAQLELEITNRYRLVPGPYEEPKELTKRDLERLWHWGQLSFPLCNLISRVPILHPDGTWFACPGYDQFSQYYLTETWEINSNPTKADTHQALDYILNTAWGEYAFVDSEISRGVFMSLILSGLYITTTPLRPGFIISAPGRDSGKTKLALTINILIDGQQITKNLSNSSDEVIRQVEADHRKGMRVNVFDNLRDGKTLWEPWLAMMLTSPTVSHKRLHTNDSIQTKNDYLAIFTGNNITGEGDLPRRVLRLYIEPQTHKRFRHEPIEFVSANRNKINIAAATIINAYRNDGRPSITSDAIGSYEIWDSQVRQNVLWLCRNFPEFKLGDPKANLAKQQTENEHDLAIAALYYELWDAFKHYDCRFTTDKLIEKMKDIQTLDQGVIGSFQGQAQPRDIRENGKRLGNHLLSLKDREINSGKYSYKLILPDVQKERNRRVFEIVRTENEPADLNRFMRFHSK